MPETKPSVTLLAYTPNPLAVIYAAFRQCYAEGSVADMWPRLLDNEISHEKQAEFIRKVMSSGHTSPIEHVSFTFALSGVSRALTHQLVRHRIASYSQQSQRYVDAHDFEYIVPPKIKADPNALERFTRCMNEIASAYSDLQAMLKAKGAGTSSNEDARFVLPQAASSRIVVSMNCRALLNFFEHRTCTRAQWEIRHVAQNMLNECRRILPEIFQFAGPPCEHLGYCPEGAFSCGRYPTKTEAQSK